MAEKNVKARIVHKHDLESNWLKSALIPKQGEIIVYDVEIDSEGNTLTLPDGRTEAYTYERFKMGDGIQNVNDLPFMIDKITDDEIDELCFDDNISFDDIITGGTSGGSGNTVYFGEEEPTDAKTGDFWYDESEEEETTQPLTFSGAVDVTYDGSEPVTVEIPKTDIPRIEMASTDTTATIEPNKLYVFPEMASLDITLGGTIDTSIVQEYRFRFTSGATATTLTLPSTVVGEISVEANKVYEVSILDGYLVIQSWEVS